LEALLQLRFASVYGPIDETPAQAPTAPKEKRPRAVVDSAAAEDDDEEEDEEEDGFEFPLFAAPKASAKPSSTDETGDLGGEKDNERQSGYEKKATRIILLDDADSLTGDGAFVVPDRDSGYFFAPAATGVVKEQFEKVAMSGDDVRGCLAQRYWGLEVPWRVRILRVTKKGAKASSTRGGTDETERVEVIGTDEAIRQGEIMKMKKKKKKKPGKKRRIVLRITTKKTQDAREKADKAKAEAEERDREKRTRRNREKKVKRKVREKAKKAGNEGGGAAEEEGGGESMIIDT
jgi:hypothetical protein